MTVPVEQLAAKKMQGIAMRKVSEHEEVKAIMEKIERVAESGEFSTILHKDVDCKTIDIRTLSAYLSLKGFHTLTMSERIIVSWNWKVTPLMPIVDALYNIVDSIDNQ